MRTVQPVLAGLTLALSVAGCGLLGGDGGDAGDGPAAGAAGLATYTGKGLRAGYPQGWAAPAKERRIFPGADFEAAAPGSSGSALPAGTFAVYVADKEQSVESLAAHYASLAEAGEGELLEHRRIDVGGHRAYVVRKAYTAAARSGPTPIRQVDVYVRVGTRQIADVRLAYPAAAYDRAAPQIASVISAIEVAGSPS